MVSEAGGRLRPPVVSKWTPHAVIVIGSARSQVVI